MPSYEKGGGAYEKDLNINRAQNASEEMVSDPISFTSEIFHNFYLYSIAMEYK